MFEVKTEKFESTIPELDYYMNFIPFVDGECVTDVIQEHIHEEILIDPYIDEDLANDVIFDNARIGIEIPKDYFDDDCEYREEYISEYSEMLERAYDLATKRETITDICLSDLEKLNMIRLNISEKVDSVVKYEDKLLNDNYVQDSIDILEDNLRDVQNSEICKLSSKELLTDNLIALSQVCENLRLEGVEPVFFTKLEEYIDDFKLDEGSELFEEQ